jgi:hypothetical protein
MSVEIRKTADGTQLECDWGVFENSEADPRRACGLKHLMLIGGDCVERMLTSGPEVDHRGSTGSATRDGTRVFFHLDYDGGRMTWELFDCYFWDGKGPHDMFIGRWPD